MKKYFTVILLFFNTLFLFSQQKSMNDARIVANNWFYHFAPEEKVNDSIVSATEYTYNDTAVFYIFNYSNGGYVLTSSDTRVKPVLAYSYTTWIDTSHITVETQEWLNLYGFQVCYIVANNVSSSENNDAWDNIEKNDFSYLSSTNMPALLEYYHTSRWACWTPYFNQFPCDYPSDWPAGWSTAKGEMGCVPLAMSQIMKFHKFPIHGSGSHSYTSTRYYTSSVTNQTSSVSCFNNVDFSSETYDYDNMPFRLTYCANGTPGCDDPYWGNLPDITQNQIDAVGILQYDAGVACNMQWFGVGTFCGPTNPGNAFSNYFNYLPVKFHKVVYDNLIAKIKLYF
jgi:hypothetical protein